MAQSWTGWSGHPAPFGARLSVLSWPTLPSVACVRVFPGVKWLERGSDHSLLLSAGLRLDSSYISAFLCACIGVSRGHHYLVRKRNFEVIRSQSARSTYSGALKTVAVCSVDICAEQECSSLRSFWRVRRALRCTPLDRLRCRYSVLSCSTARGA
jgi:hypothetical protein